MLDKILFWVVLVWMIGMLVMAIIAVRDVWKEDSKLEGEDNDEGPSPAKPKEPVDPGGPNLA
jgi:hypothetical protein